jgi:hypothetical protein
VVNHPDIAWSVAAVLQQAHQGRAATSGTLRFLADVVLKFFWRITVFWENIVHQKKT